MRREALGVTGNPMTAQFDFSRDEVVKARLAYAATTRFARGFRRYGFLFLCAAFFLISLAQNDPFQAELVIKDESYPIVSASITIAMVLFVSILFAWGRGVRQADSALRSFIRPTPNCNPRLNQA